MYSHCSYTLTVSWRSICNSFPVFLQWGNFRHRGRREPPTGLQLAHISALGCYSPLFWYYNFCHNVISYTFGTFTTRPSHVRPRLHPIPRPVCVHAWLQIWPSRPVPPASPALAHRATDSINNVMSPTSPFITASSIRTLCCIVSVIRSTANRVTPTSANKTAAGNDWTISNLMKRRELVLCD